GTISRLHRQIRPEIIAGPIAQGARANRFERVPRRLPLRVAAAVVERLEDEFRRIGLAYLAVVNYQSSRRANSLLVRYFKNQAIDREIKLLFLEEVRQRAHRVLGIRRLKTDEDGGQDTPGL